MTAYAIAVLHPTDASPDLRRYLEGIDATLEPFGGRFVVHGGDPEILEGEPDGTPVLIAFPDREAAGAWYRSPAYRAIVGHRTAHTAGWVGIVDGVGEEHRATDVWDAIVAAAPAA